MRSWFWVSPENSTGYFPVLGHLQSLLVERVTAERAETQGILMLRQLRKTGNKSVFEDNMATETNSDNAHLCSGHERVGGADAHGVSPTRVIQILPHRAFRVLHYQTDKR